jgi:5-methylthioadenosine/S-adenosylhomocysteine deaminase
MTGFVRGRFVLPMSDAIGRDTRIEDGYVVWRGDVILETGQYSPDVGRRLVAEHGPELEVLGGPGRKTGAASVDDLIRLDGVVLPGFVKAHGHDHEPPIIGLVKDVPLTHWLDGVVNVFTKFLSERRDELTAELGESPQLVSYLKARVDDLYYGITSSMVHHCNFAKYYAEDLAEANRRAGTTMIIAVGSQDRHYAGEILDVPHTVAVERLDRYHERLSGVPRVTVVPGPDQFFSNGPELLKAAKAWARDHGVLLHCHSSEEGNTTRWFVETYGQTEVEYARDIGILDEHTVLAHQVHTTPGDLDILARSGTKVVHNPLANTILGSGMPPVIEMLARGIPVAISTDGSGSADNQNILAAARLASQYQKAFHQDATLLTAQKVLEMITADAADVLGLNAGRLEPGRAADLIVVGLSRPNLTPTRVSNVVENLIWAADGSEVEHVVAGGRVLRSGSRYFSLDVADILGKVTTLAERFDRYRESAAPALTGTGAHR